MATLGEFGRRMRTVRARQMREGRNRVKKLAATRVVETVVNNTPILSGRARANWNVGLNAANRFITDPLYQETTISWQLKLSTSVAAISRAGANDTIYISNSLPYIGFLNRGGSQQAPRDYVMISTLAASRSLRNATIFR